LKTERKQGSVIKAIWWPVAMGSADSAAEKG